MIGMPDKIELDTIDRKIIAQLDKNSRISYSDLGRKIRVAKETVKYRMNQLEKLGVLNGFYTVVDFSKLGFTLYRIYVRIKNTDPKKEIEILNYLKESENVAILYRINGPFHIVVGIWMRNIWEYEKFWNSIKEKFGEYISSTHFSIMTNYMEFSRSYLLQENEKIQFLSISQNKPEEIDTLDRKLLAFISNNARASLVQISKSLGIGIITARYRLKNLISKKIIVGFRTIINLKALGREYYKVDFALNDFEMRNELAESITSHPNVVYTERTLGGSDLEIDMEIENFTQFISIMDGFSSKFSGKIRDYTYYSLIENCKTNYVPFKLDKEK